MGHSLSRRWREHTLTTTPAKYTRKWILLLKKLLKWSPYCNKGLWQCDVARQLNLSRFSARRVRQRFEETGGYIRRRGSGRQRCTSERDDRFIVSSSLRHRLANSVKLQQQRHSARRRTVSVSTIRRRFREKKIAAHRAATGPKLTARNRRDRLQFARDHIDWTIEQWRTVLISDETRICLHCNDRRRRVYRRQGSL
jgi:hypothetical protein